MPRYPRISPVTRTGPVTRNSPVARSNAQHIDMRGGRFGIHYNLAFQVPIQNAVAKVMADLGVSFWRGFVNLHSLCPTEAIYNSAFAGDPQRLYSQGGLDWAGERGGGLNYDNWMQQLRNYGMQACIMLLKIPNWLSQRPSCDLATTLNLAVDFTGSGSQSFVFLSTAGFYVGEYIGIHWKDGAGGDTFAQVTAVTDSTHATVDLGGASHTYDKLAAVTQFDDPQVYPPVQYDPATQTELDPEMAKCSAIVGEVAYRYQDVARFFQLGNEWNSASFRDKFTFYNIGTQDWVFDIDKNAAYLAKVLNHWGDAMLARVPTLGPRILQFSLGMGNHKTDVITKMMRGDTYPTIGTHPLRVAGGSVRTFKPRYNTVLPMNHYGSRNQLFNPGAGTGNWKVIDNELAAADTDTPRMLFTEVGYGTDPAYPNYNTATYGGDTSNDVYVGQVNYLTSASVGLLPFMLSQAEFNAAGVCVYSQVDPGNEPSFVGCGLVSATGFIKPGYHAYRSFIRANAL